MTPTHTWIVIAAVGIVLGLWALADGWWDYRVLQAAHRNGLLRSIVAGAAAQEVLGLFVCSVFLWIGILAETDATPDAEWSWPLVAFLTAEAVVVAQSMIRRLSRWRVMRHMERG